MAVDGSSIYSSCRHDVFAIAGAQWNDLNGAYSDDLNERFDGSIRHISKGNHTRCNIEVKIK